MVEWKEEADGLEEKTSSKDPSSLNLSRSCPLVRQTSSEARGRGITLSEYFPCDWLPGAISPQGKAPSSR